MSCLWSLRHVVFTIDFTWHCFRLRLVCSTGLFSMLCSSMLDGRSGMLFLPFSACLSSGMFLLSACFGMFDFGMFKYFLLSACCIPRTHTHTCGQVLVLLVTGRAQLRYMCSSSLVYACPVYGRSGMLFLPISFLHVYHFLHVYLPACFFFPPVSACLILACLSTFFFRPAAFHTHTCGQVLVLFVVATTGRAQLRLSNAVQRRHDRFCFLHAGFHHVVPHTHLRPGAGLARGRYDRQGPTALEQTGRAQLRLSNAVQRRHDVREILQLSCSNKIARMKPLCLCNCRRYLSSELLGRRTGACLTA